MRAYFDIDTQVDFMDKNGALYVPGAEQIKHNLKQLTEYAIAGSINLMGSIDTHTQNDPEFKDFPPHCIRGTHGWNKIPETFNRPSLWLGMEAYELSVLNTIVEEVRSGRKSLYFEKNNFDVFSNPHTEWFLNELGVKEIVAYGVATDYCVKESVMGFLKRGIDVYVVADAIAAVDVKTGDGAFALEEMLNAGAVLVGTDGIFASDFDIRAKLINRQKVLHK